ncbi:MAG: hypothetical protein JW818_16795, partial [Pirellulales bacterium]|nr:hypothetical protein [Pirellulales bacterium]
GSGLGTRGFCVGIRAGCVSVRFWWTDQWTWGLGFGLENVDSSGVTPGGGWRTGPVAYLWQGTSGPTTTSMDWAGMLWGTISIC